MLDWFFDRCFLLVLFLAPPRVQGLSPFTAVLEVKHDKRLKPAPSEFLPTETTPRIQPNQASYRAVRVDDKCTSTILLSLHKSNTLPRTSFQPLRDRGGRTSSSDVGDRLPRKTYVDPCSYQHSVLAASLFLSTSIQPLRSSRTREYLRPSRLITTIPICSISR